MGHQSIKDQPSLRERANMFSYEMLICLVHLFGAFDKFLYISNEHREF